MPKHYERARDVAKESARMLRYARHGDIIAYYLMPRAR